jgi:crystallin, alpha B
MTRVHCSKVTLNVSHFKPEEVSIKIADNFLVIEAKHEERPDEHGFVCRQFTRRYLLPSGVKPEDITRQFSPEGVLTITAPRALPAPTPSVEVVAPSPSPQPQEVPTQKPEPQPAPTQQ